ncbi:hypothetical protein ERYG_05600, partial [Escherichia coli M114]
HTAEATLPNGNNDTKTVNIAPDASNAQVTLNIPAQQVVTNNSDSVQLTATVKDPSNHPVAGITVNFTMPQDVAANFTLKVTVLPSLRPMAKRMYPQRQKSGHAYGYRNAG